jgi:hypothetical protein
MALFQNVSSTVIGQTGLLFASDCVAKNNTSELATNFIARCCKGSIKSVFPGEMYSKTVGEIKKGKSKSHKTAWKLLNDGRFKK